MLTRRFMLSTIFQVCLLLSGTVAFAQGQWVGDLYLKNCFSNTFNTSSILIDENDKIKKIIPNFALQENFSSLYNNARFSESYWHNGALYTITSNQNYKNQIFARYQDDKWHFLGKINFDEILLKAILCDNDRFIAIFQSNEGMDIKSRSKMTPLPSGVHFLPAKIQH